ncbi:hypothetical protein, partial [Escherichia coli]|uniref:hypothetical protein n=1 Tax=Escherichia coli TaxID=562 RepID=UPI001952D43B
VIVVPCEMRSTITVKQLISLSPIDRLAFHYQVKADAPDQNGEPIYPSTRFPELTAEFNSRYGPPLRTITSGNGQDDPPLHNPYGGPIPT